jgi:hypothetical protein
MYSPTQGIFINGRVADATDLVNEFAAIAAGINEVDGKVVSKAEDAEDNANGYTDGLFLALDIDGGTF